MTENINREREQLGLFISNLFRLKYCTHLKTKDVSLDILLRGGNRNSLLVDKFWRELFSLPFGDISSAINKLVHRSFTSILEKSFSSVVIVRNNCIIIRRFTMSLDAFKQPE